MMGRWSKLLSLAMAIVVPCSIMSAETRGAMLNATNPVIVNGSGVSNATALFPGDKLTVPSGSVATITLHGTSILVPNLSNITFNGNSVALEPQTAVSVTTTAGMAAEIKNIHITPAKSASTQYQVARFDGKVVVAAKLGDVLLNDGSGSRVVPEGKAMVVTDPDPQKPGSVPATTGPRFIPGEIPTWVAVLIAVAAAGAAAGIAIATTGKPATATH
jgi:hypothetical protein